MFREDADRDAFIGLLARYLRDPLSSEVGLYSACIMSTHFHLVVRAESDEALAKFMQRLMASYSIYFRAKYGGEGPLFNGPYRRKRITDDQQFRWTVAYVHDNHPSGPSYRYSTHRFWDSGDCPSWIHAAEGLRAFGGPGGYAEYMRRKATRKEIDRDFFVGGRRSWD